MVETSLPRLTRILGEQLAESVRVPLPAHTRRRTFGGYGTFKNSVLQYLRKISFRFPQSAQ